MRTSEIFKTGLACAAFSLLLATVAWAQSQPASSTPPSPPAGSAVTPADARHAIDILQDDRRRAELVRTLKAIAAASPGSSEPAASASTSSTTAAAASLAAGSPPPAQTGAAGAASATDGAAPAKPDTIVPLEAGGLIARTLGSLDRWMDNFIAQVSEARDAALQIPALLTQSRAVTTTAGQRMLGLLALALAAAFAVGLLLEWSLHRALRRPREALADHANRLAIRHARVHAGPDVSTTAVTAPGAQTEPGTPIRSSAAIGAGTPGESRSASGSGMPIGAAAPRASAAAPSRPMRADPTREAAEAGLQPATEGMAVVQTHRDGIDRVETVQVGPENAGGSPHVRPAADPVPTRDPRGERWQESSRHHWSTLRNLPYAAGALILEVLPVALFFIAASLTLRVLAGGDRPEVAEAVGGFIEAYVALRLTVAVVRLLVSPAGQGLRLLDVSPAMAALTVTWIRTIAGLALFGMAVADTIPLLGTGVGLRLAFVKAVSLLVHLSAVIFILKLRRPVRHAMRAAPDATGPLTVARNWLAEAWAIIAIVLVMGVWVVWAMGVEDGFPKLIHFVLVSAAVLVAARLLAILILGALGRLVSSGNGTADGDGAADTAAQAGRRLSDRYYPWMRGLVSVVLTVSTIVALFEAWGADALSWFAAGTLGRSLASAALTIVIAVAFAILIWEAAQYAVERRLNRWTRLGDTVRAARLRTLLPMLRTALFIVIALIVGLTALNELGVNTTPLLAGASIIGVAVGFGSQKLVQDFITGIFLLMENAMRVGDWVTVAGVSGSVEYLSIRTVRLRGGDGALYIVPFSSVSTVSNSNRGIGNAAVRISVAYDTDIDMVVRELKQIGTSLREDANFKEQILNDIEVWGVDSVDGSMVTLVGQMRCSDKGRWGVQREINRRILERFRELGIEIANPRASLLVPADASPLSAPGSADGSNAPGGQQRGDGGRQQQRTT
jgi:small-conductance mechanosensitive channel